MDSTLKILRALPNVQVRLFLLLPPPFLSHSLFLARPAFVVASSVGDGARFATKKSFFSFFLLSSGSGRFSFLPFRSFLVVGFWSPSTLHNFCSSRLHQLSISFPIHGFAQFSTCCLSHALAVYFQMARDGREKSGALHSLFGLSFFFILPAFMCSFNSRSTATDT